MGQQSLVATYDEDVAPGVNVKILKGLQFTGAFARSSAIDDLQAPIKPDPFDGKVAQVDYVHALFTALIGPYQMIPGERA